MINAGKSEKEVVSKYGQAAFNAVNAQNLGEGNLGHNEMSSIHQEGGSWIVTYKKDGTKEKVFKSKAEAKKFQNSLDENYFSNYGQDESTYEEDETEADALYQRGADHYNNGAKEMAAKFRQAAILMGKRTHQDAGEFPSYDDNEGESEFDELREDIFNPGFVSRGAILKALADVGSASEIRQYLTSLERSGDEYETLEDYVEDFLNYVADKSLNESYNPFPMNEDQEAVLKRYAESTGIAFENLLNMVAEAKAKKKAKPDFLDLDNDGDKEESMKKAAQDKKKAMSENEAFEDDNEPHELHIILSQLAKNAIELAKDLRELEAEGIDNLPQWFQAKIIIAKSYIQGAKEYLEGEMNNGLDGNEEIEEAIRLSDKSGGNQYFRSDADATSAMDAAKKAGVTLTKTNIPG
jgi:hypothetical protein